MNHPSQHASTERVPTHEQRRAYRRRRSGPLLFAHPVLPSARRPWVHADGKHRVATSSARTASGPVEVAIRVRQVASSTRPAAATALQNS